MSYRAWFYIYTVLLAGVGAGMLAFTSPPQLDQQWLPFITLTMLATLAQLFWVEAPNHVSYYASPVFVFAAMLLLDPALFVLLVIIYHGVEWVKERLVGSTDLRDWYIQPFNMASDILAALVARHVYNALVQQSTIFGTFAWAMVGPCAALAFVLINHALLGIALMLARGKSWRETGMLDSENLLSDWLLLLLGHVVAALWEINPWLIVSALMPLVLMYRALTIPQLKQEAQTDSKTGLNNVRWFQQRFAQELERAQRLERPLAVIMGDLDYLRTINNTYGHLAGDAVLIGISKIIRDSIRSQDLASRFGGEEFAFVLPDCTREQAYAFAERVRTAIEDARFEVPTTQAPIRATMSLGIACFPDDARTATDLTHEADIAVYQAKTLGRNRVICAVDIPAAVKAEGIPAKKEQPDTPAAPHSLPDSNAAASTSGADSTEGSVLSALLIKLASHDVIDRIHASRVANYAVDLAIELGLPAARIEQVRHAAYLHDIGKIGVTRTILSKPTRLTEQEYIQVQAHAEIGAALVASNEQLYHLAPFIRHHHERWDGRGYPDGLCGEDIPLESRIIALCDTFEAMSSDRPYRSRIRPRDVIAELQRCAGHQFDPQIATRFIALLEREQPLRPGDDGGESPAVLLLSTLQMPDLIKTC